jgi:ABC-type transport system substrate-binding protein
MEINHPTGPCGYTDPLYAAINADWAAIGLAATWANGMKGIYTDGEDFNWYLAQVFNHANFDGYLVFYSLGRIPDQLYSLLHSSQDSLTHPGRRNAPGVNDPTIDALTETVKFSLNVNDIETAAKTVQEMLYTPDKSVYPNADHFALAYMTMYSRTYFNGYSPNLRGVVRSPGYGSDNRWTDLNIYWEPGTERIENGKTAAIFDLHYSPGTLNPLYADEYYEWDILARQYDGLTGINPYNHNDLSWLAEDWTITETVAGMNIDFTLRDNIHWQDGKPFTAYDVEFSLEFLRDYQVPRYAATWDALMDVVVTDAAHFTIIADEPSIDLFYDFSNLAPRLPEHIWNRFGDPTDPANRQAALDYDPTEPYNVAPGYTQGLNPTPTNLFGTGPFIFQFYDDVDHYCDLWRNENYFKTASDVGSQMTEMFHEVGDVNEDGIIDVLDQQTISFAYGYFVGEPNYNPAADIVQAPFVVDIKDLATAGAHLGGQREYP